jgi:hypothetical protein
MGFTDWLIKQFTEFNVLIFLLIIFFSTSLTKSNAKEQLKNQTTEFKEKIEELKDEIWHAVGRDKN